MREKLDTYFASVKRADKDKLVSEIKIVSHNPVVSGLLNSISGLLAVLDEHRQVVAINDSFLHMLGIADPSTVLGLRPGEIMQCVHAYDEPAGCGTTKFCSTCGAAISIVYSLGQNKPVEKLCALTTKRGSKDIDIVLLVKSHPIEIDRQRFLLLFLQDITQQQQRAALERTFFHDINNMLYMLVGASELLLLKEHSELALNIHQASLRLGKEVAIQKFLSHTESCDYLPVWIELKTEKILDELRSFFTSHPAAAGKKITISNSYPDVPIKIDFSLLSRILCNMIINALEASAEDSEVKIWIEYNNHSVSFCVWNMGEIPKDISYRIFQRNFSTKDQAGRGTGTFSMKLLGEKILGGKVSFTTSREEGTTFRFTYPV